MTECSHCHGSGLEPEASDELVIRRPRGMSDADWRDWCGYVRVRVAVAVEEARAASEA